MKHKVHPLHQEFGLFPWKMKGGKVPPDRKKERMGYRKICVGQQNHDKLQTEEWRE